MGTGILICGLNGTGKSTLGKALAEMLQFYFIDHEDLYFPEMGLDDRYASPHTREEAETRLFSEIQAHENFIFASVKGDYGEAVYPFFQYAVYLQVPKEIRLQRVENRSYQQFGNRMDSGGDLHDQEERFFQFVASRAENTVEEWLPCLNCPIIRIDGTKPIEENVHLILEPIERDKSASAVSRLGWGMRS